MVTLILFYAKLSFFLFVMCAASCEDKAHDARDIVNQKVNAKRIYELSSEPMDVIFVCHPKDSRTLDLAIDGIKKNGKNIRRVIVVSSQKLSSQAEWFDEASYPFNKTTVAQEIFVGDLRLAQDYLSGENRIGWVYQQLLKLYAPFVIPNISSNVLVVDADTIFQRPVDFMDASGNPLFNVATEYHKPYFAHAARLLPDLKKVYPNYSGVVHHMLFQEPILKDLFNLIELVHKTEPWRALCRCIDINELSGSSLSEYEIYFNFVFSKTGQAKIRPLQWENIQFSLENVKKSAGKGNDYVSCHSWM